jgi:hypothetical protein
LKIDELCALLVNNDPPGPIHEPNKKIGQDKANLWHNVQAALGRYLAVAAVSTPSLLPILVVHVIYEGENI